MILQVGELETTNKVWEEIKGRHVGADRVREARLQTLAAEFDRLKIKDSDSIDDFVGKISEISSKSAAVGEAMEETKLVKFFLKSLPRKKIIHIVSSLEQLLDLKTTSFEDIIGRLRAYEERISEEEEDRQDNQNKLMYANMETQSNQDYHGEYRGRGHRGRYNNQGRARGQSSYWENRDTSKPYWENRDPSKSYWENRDATRVTCFRCDKQGHFAATCPD